jgi:hypothetical protein
MNRNDLLQSLVCLCLGCACAYSQTTGINIGTKVLQPSVARLGINLSLETFYDSGQMTRNLIFRNPGFEGEIFQSVIRCASGTSATCVDDDPYSGWPDGFWNHATVEVFFGFAKGRVDTVTSYTGAHAPSGGTFTFSGEGVVPHAGDYMIVRMVVPGKATAGWIPSISGAATVSTNSKDLPAGTDGRQTVALSAPTSNDAAGLATYFDSTAGRTFVMLNGAFQLSFKAKGTSGSNSIALSLQRAGLPAYVSQTLKLTDAWATYTFPFNASETGAVTNAVALKFNTVDADSFLLDDVSLTQTDSDPNNPTAFRDPVVNALKKLNPGVLRFWAGQLGDTLDNLLAGPFGRQRSGYSAFSNQQDDISYGLADFLQLCRTVGAEPWVVVPTTFSTKEAANLIDYLAGAANTPYGAKRAAGGQTAPWTSLFPKIHLEFGNESWNGVFKGGAIEYPAPYGQRAQAIFAAMRAQRSNIPSKFDLVLGGQAASPGRNLDIQNNCDNNDTFALAPYLMSTVDSFSNNEELFGSMFAEAEAFQSPKGIAESLSGGLMLQNQQVLQTSTHPVPMVVYEMNLHTTLGSITQAALNKFASSLGAGLAVADSMLQQMRQGVLRQCLFALPQYQFRRNDGSMVDLWGSVVDMGVTNRRRPQFLAVQLVNQAIGDSAKMLQTVHSGDDPTWNQPLINSVQLPDAHYLQSFAFESGSAGAVIVFNLHRTSSERVTFSGANAPSGTVEMSRLTSAAITDTNETSSKVNIRTQSLPDFSSSDGLSLPPYSMTVLRWTRK